MTPCYILVMFSFHADISELNLPKTCEMSFPNGKDDLMNFEVTIHPDEGYYMYTLTLISVQCLLF